MGVSRSDINERIMPVCGPRSRGERGDEGVRVNVVVPAPMMGISQFVKN